jgi:hypothetical protein
MAKPPDAGSTRGREPTIEVVVARYREDVSWLAALPWPAVVYDKSGTPGPHALPNVGRESHTFLHHILSRYPEFPDCTVFLQADPFPHLAPGTRPEGLARTIAELAARGVAFKGLADYTVRCDALGRPHHLRDELGRGKWAGWGRDIPVGELYAALFAGPVPESFHTRAPAGLLFVSSGRILARPRGLYARAMAAILADPQDAGNTGHALERLWSLIFNGYAALNKAAYD